MKYSKNIAKISVLSSLVLTGLFAMQSRSWFDNFTGLSHEFPILYLIWGIVTAFTFCFLLTSLLPPKKNLILFTGFLLMAELCFPYHDPTSLSSLIHLILGYTSTSLLLVFSFQVDFFPPFYHQKRVLMLLSLVALGWTGFMVINTLIEVVFVVGLQVLLLYCFLSR